MTLRFASWCRDGLRLFAALFYWNLRKSIFVIRGRSGRAPCQSNSDDEVAGCISCDAVMHWDQPARFRRVCPLLKQRDGAWRCSVLPGQVRTYWLRALRWYAAGVVGLYLMGVVALWTLMNVAGEAQVSFWKLAWPGAWGEVSHIQSAELYRNARIDFAQGNYRGALSSLGTAVLRDPGNYPAALLVAQINMFKGSFLYSDNLYEALLRDHPEHVELTAVNYHDALLALNRQGQLADHSLKMASSDSKYTALWVNSFLLAIREPAVAAEIGTTHSLQISRLPEFARMLVVAQILESQNHIQAARNVLSEPFRGPWNLQYIQAQVTQLLQLKVPSTAEILLGYYGPGLLIHESMAQQYLIEYAKRDEWNALATFNGLVHDELNAARILRLQLLLLRAPQRESYLKLHERLREKPELQNQVNRAVMWITGLVCDASAEADSWKEPEQLIYGRTYPAISEVDFEVTRISEVNSVLHIINVVDLPREVILELLGRMNEQRRRALAGDKKDVAL